MRTRIWDSGRNRPAHYGPTATAEPGSPAAALAAQLAERAQAGLDPTAVAEQMLAAMRADELYVFTHHSPEWRSELEERFGGILAAMDKAAGR